MSKVLSDVTLTRIACQYQGVFENRVVGTKALPTTEDVDKEKIGRCIEMAEDVCLLLKDMDILYSEEARVANMRVFDSTASSAEACNPRREFRENLGNPKWNVHTVVELSGCFIPGSQYTANCVIDACMLPGYGPVETGVYYQFLRDVVYETDGSDKYQIERWQREGVHWTYPISF
jgi:hypothetical protein